MLARPAIDESIPYYRRYIDLVPEGDLLDLLARQAEEIAAILRDCTPAQAGYRPEPGEWSTIEIVGHLADTERVLAYRALRIARGDTTPLEGVDDFPGYVAAAGFGARAAAGVAAEYLAVRAASLAFLRPLDAAAWARLGTADGAPISVRALAYIIAGHDLHHLADLRRYRDAT